MHLLLPRRHRRRLLLPPGLLALAGLLLLGCLALRPWQERLKRHSVVQLTVPKPWEPHHSHEMLRFVFSPLLLPECSCWYDSYLDGRFPGDARRLEAIRQQAAVLHNAPALDQRLRVQLGPRATYAELLRLLDFMKEYDLRRYVVDMQHEPVTLYVLGTSLTQQRRWSASTPRVGSSNLFLRSYPTPAQRQRAFAARCRNWQQAMADYRRRTR